MKDPFALCVVAGVLLMNCSTALTGSIDSEEYCPTMCYCDLYMDMNRANCSNRNLVHAQINMPKAVEILDMSYNDITALNNECFGDLKRLTSLTLAHNAIDAIELDAFAKLKKIQHLSLAGNRLSQFDHRIVEKSYQLESIDLSGNKLMGLDSVPLLKSRSLQTIDLHGSQITHLYRQTFQELPHLQSVDLSDNLLITLDTLVFMRNHKLKSLNLTGNPWNCDENMQRTLKRLKQKRINVTIAGCAISVRPKFERMEVRSTEIPADVPAADIRLDSVWKLIPAQPWMEMTCPLNNTDKACDMFESCISVLTNVYREVGMQNERLQAEKNSKSVHRKYMLSLTSIQAVLYAGLLSGSILGGTFVYITMIICRRCHHKDHYELPRLQRSNAIRRNRGSIETTSTLQADASPSMTPWQHRQVEPASQQPIATRRRDRRPVRCPSQPMVRHSSSFFGSLFDRPMRRRYARSINQNATNLVRRLSQSRLFLNSSRSNGASVPSSPVTATTDTSRLLDNEPPNQHRVTLSSAGAEYETLSASLPNVAVQLPSTEDALLSDIVIQRLRSESPPPAYKDVVTTKVA